MSRQQIGQAILDLCAGQVSETAFLAESDALACGIGGTHYLTGHTLAEALAVADEIAGATREHIIKHWGTIERGDQ